MIPGVILAAGDSSRMGRPKALLPFDASRTFVEQLVLTFRAGGAAEVLVVVGRDAAAIEDRLAAAAPQVRVVRNARYREGQATSLVAALDVVDRPGVEGLMVTLVDMPLVSADTVRLLLARHRATRAPVVRPARGALHGHPVIFDRALFDELRRVDPLTGARSVVHAHAARVENVEVDDEGAFTDIDTPAAYARVIGLPLEGISDTVR
jgi:CTP:molybdopterin cytidylyltransferase MocA